MANNKLAMALAASQGQSNVTVTTNGSGAFKSTLNSVLDFFSRGPSFRKNPAGGVGAFTKAISENELLALRAAFYLRDVRGGQGERAIFRAVIKWLAVNRTKVLEQNLWAIPEYGRWDDLFELIGTPLEQKMLDAIAVQLRQDLLDLKAGKNVSLLAKWMKSENASSKVSKKIATKLRKSMNLTSAEYRVTLVALRKQIDIVESKMSAKNFEAIDYSKVPSRASLLYKDAFTKRDSNRYAKFIAKVNNGETTIKATTIYPYELYNKAITGYDNTVEALWKNLPNYVHPDLNAIVIADTSGSMAGIPMSISVSLAIYFAERNKGPFANQVITFDSNPWYVDLSSYKTLKNKIDHLHTQTKHGGSTNLQATFDMILDTAVRFKVSQADMPKALIIVSDMQFNTAARNRATDFEVAKKKFEAKGYTLPGIVFWNVNNNSNSPVEFDTTGAALVGGSSPTVFKAFTDFLATGKVLTPVDMMVNTLNGPRYEKITV